MTPFRGSIPPPPLDIYIYIINVQPRGSLRHAHESPDPAGMEYGWIGGLSGALGVVAQGVPVG